jgi:hypothetical protein
MDYDSKAAEPHAPQLQGGILYEHVTKNPVMHVATRSKSPYRAITITPAQTVAILKSLSSAVHYTPVLTCAATALRLSETLARRWADETRAAQGEFLNAVGMSAVVNYYKSCGLSRGLEFRVSRPITP